MLPKKSFTEYERLGISSDINLSDAHARQERTEAQSEIVGNLGRLYVAAEQKKQGQLEQEFIDTFLRLAGQRQHFPYNRYFLSYAASCAIDMVSQLCREHGYTVGLIEPCFDNISNYLLRRGVPLVPVGDVALFRNRCLPTDNIQVLWMVAPNNPSGLWPTREVFTNIVEQCVARNIIIVADFCFRFFADGFLAFDQHGILIEKKARFIIIEDTGKTWPTLDIKCGITLCSNDLSLDLFQRHDDLLLNVSPFALALITEFLINSSLSGLTQSVRAEAWANRATLLSALSEFPWVQCRTAQNTFPLLWMEILRESDCAIKLYMRLSSKGVHVLPGANFFWSDRNRGRNCFRIALNRPRTLINTGAAALVEVLREFE